MQVKRISLWDNAKFLLILSVVLGHFLEQYMDSSVFRSLFLFLYTFHMPLFLFISGLFHKNTNIGRKVVSYLSVYVVFKIVIFAVRSLLEHKIASFSLLKESGTPWFMFCLAVFALVTYLLRNLNQKYLLVLSVILACFAGYDSSIGDGFVLSRIIVFYPFYLAGSMLNREKLEAVLQKKPLKIGAAVVLAAWLAICLLLLDRVYVLRPLFTGRNPFGENILPFGFALRLLCYALTCLTGFSVLLLIPRKNLGFLTTCGQRTLQVYFWHRIAIYVLSCFGAAEALCGSVPGKLLWLVIGVCLTLVLSLKPFRYPTDLLLNKMQKRS